MIKEATAACDTALRLAPDDPIVLSDSGWVYALSGTPGAAVTVLRRGSPASACAKAAGGNNVARLLRLGRRAVATNEQRSACTLAGAASRVEPAEAMFAE